MEVEAEACIEGESMFADPLLVGGHFQLSEAAVFAMVAIIVAQLPVRVEIHVETQTSE
jgi:hypothetical protein